MKKALIVVMLCVPLAWAADPAIIDFTGGTEYTSYYGSAAGDVVGWTFRVNEPMAVTDLGVYVDMNGMGSPHRVGIWDMNENLLLDSTVNPSDPQIGKFKYVDVSDISLNVGQEYVIGAMYTSTDNDNYISGASTANVDPAITWLNSRYPTIGELGFVFPGLTSASVGRFGPNFLFIPEPATLGLLALGLLLRRR